MISTIISAPSTFHFHSFFKVSLFSKGTKMQPIEDLGERKNKNYRQKFASFRLIKATGMLDLSRISSDYLIIINKIIILNINFHH